ncbi:MAG: hypothetical protein WBM53_09945, partial [Maribacter sp.]
MKTLTVIIFALILLSTSLVQNEKNIIKGILYSDENFISITMENGKISVLEKLDNPKNTMKQYIAPGLIDVQINGYMG